VFKLKPPVTADALNVTGECVLAEKVEKSSFPKYPS
jgi:hypothetical protein